MVILTDGIENSSQTYTQRDIKRMINEMKYEYNWKFVFLGANQDAIVTGSKIGVYTCCSFSTGYVGHEGSTGPAEHTGSVDLLPSMSNICKSVSTSVKKYKVASCKTKNTNIDIKLD